MCKMKLFKDYQIVQNKLCKFGIDEKKHLMWKYGGVPAIDKIMWDKLMKSRHKIDEIYFRTKKSRRFLIDAKVFDNNKIEFDLGFGKQYYVEKELWDIVGGDKKPMQLGM